MSRPLAEPIDLSQFNVEIRDVFKGLTIMNNGTILVAYKQPMRLSRIVIVNSALLNTPVCIPEGARFVIETHPINPQAIIRP
jgi:hypothetical protein